MKILVTGSGGFIGRELCDRLDNEGQHVLKIVRSRTADRNQVAVGDLGSFRGWEDLLDGVDVVVHLAGRAHILSKRAEGGLEDYRRVNTNATLSLAQDAARAGVKRLIFVSTIGVNGNTTQEKPFANDDVPRPCSNYALSKYEAEIALGDISRSTSLETVIIRPPLVHGPNAPGNFGKMIRWLASGIPLPLGAITGNRRSLVGVDNLIDLICTCVVHPKAANQTFLVSDGHDLSTTELLEQLSSSLGVRPRLYSIPPTTIRFIADKFGKRDLVERLVENLQVDIQYTRETLSWSPPVSIAEGFAKIGRLQHR